jgi:magnesium transporter
VRGSGDQLRLGFEIRDGALVETGEEPAAIELFVAPDEDERRTLVDEHGLDPYDVDSALDPDEISRVEFAHERVSLIWKRPKNATFDPQLRFEVSSLGLFLAPERLLVVLAEGPHPFGAKEFKGVRSATDVVLRLLLHTVRHYVGHLKVIKQQSGDLERKISASMENRYLLQMFTLGESLTYYLNAIEANGAVLGKLKSTVERVAFPKPDPDLLDDLTLENQQCARQAQIYSSVLSGLMDARGTIVNNNMNVLLKNLTLINVIFLPLNLIASVLGMSEFTVMTQGMDWRLAYGLFGAGMVVLGWLTWHVLIRVIDPERARRATGEFT